jgi:uncharacterized coiled-coil DUF342 family protein
MQELEQRLLHLREVKDHLGVNAAEQLSERNKLNEEAKAVRSEITAFRDERDRLNAEIKELKQQREEARTGAKEKIEELKKLRQKRSELSMEKPAESHQALQREIWRIDWKIQTTPLDLKEEKQLVERVKRLETSLNVHRRIEDLGSRILEVESDVKSLHIRGRLCHEKLTGIAESSQEIHQKMLAKIEELKTIRAEADRMHKLLLETREKTRNAEREIIETAHQLAGLKGEIRAEESKEKKEREDALRRKLVEQAKEKLGRREKLTWEEFRLLDDGTETQD